MRRAAGVILLLGHAVVLGNRGAFVVRPDGPDRSRLTVRISGAGSAPAPAIALTFLTFEPVHFIMERAMLLGIRERAERALSKGGPHEACVDRIRDP